MLLKKTLVLALLLAATADIDAGHTVRSERHDEKDHQQRRMKSSKGEGPKPTKDSKKGTGGATARAGGAGGGGNRAGGAGGGGKKNGGGGTGGQPGANRFGTPGVPVVSPQVWSPGKAVNLRGSPNIGQDGQAVPVPVPVPIPGIGNKGTGTGTTTTVTVQPVSNTNTPVANGWNRGEGTAEIAGQYCYSSNPNKFRCCNNEGSSACAAAGFGDCCDAWRNMCVNTAGLDPTARNNLSCKAG